MSLPTSIVWFRQDLRVADHTALLRAAERGFVVPVYLWSPEEEGDWPPGGASKWWLHHSLKSLAKQLEELGAQLILRSGNSLDCLQNLVDETGASAVYWSRRYEPASIERDEQIKKRLRTAGLEVESFNGSLLHEPWEIETKAGGPYKVFTPFWKACLASGAVHDPLEPPEKLKSPKSRVDSIQLDELGLLPKRNWDKQFFEVWDVGASAAEDALEQFARDRLGNYQEDRNRIDIRGYSRLSPHLHFGELSPRQVWVAVQAACKAAEDDQKPTRQKSSEVFLAEIGWREFAYHLLYFFPATPQQPLREKFADFPWSDSKEKLAAWQQGQTGYPVVDAAMRELWATGFMPNRARMIVASFLTKHLRIPWQRGAECFWDTLVDADLASNTLGWQWTAGCGADAAPYFRIFNPMTQSEKFDPHGDSIRRWIPEIAALPGKLIHQPWTASPEQLAAANVELGEDYPLPIVEHSAARKAALAAYKEIQ